MDAVALDARCYPQHTSDLIGRMLMPQAKQDINRCSAAVLTSHTLAPPSKYQQHANNVIKEVTSEIAKVKHQIANPTTVSPENLEAPSKSPEQCPHHADTINEALTPRAYKALYETTKSLIKETSKPKSLARSSVRASLSGKGDVNSTAKSLQTRLHCCCKLNNQGKNKESCTRSTQAEIDARHCPHCTVEPLRVPQDQDLGIDNVEEYLKSYLRTSCRYYTNILTKHLDRVKENLKNHLTIPGDGLYKASSLSNFLVEACTMKPSGRQDHCCQTNVIPNKLKNLNKLLTLTTALSATDFRESQDKQDLKAMYRILSSIEGRVHRLKSHLLT